MDRSYYLELGNAGLAVPVGTNLVFDVHGDAEAARPQVEQLTADLIRRMRAPGHPFILGSECDVLSVDGCRATIIAKVQAFLDVARRMRPDAPAAPARGTG